MKKTVSKTFLLILTALLIAPQIGLAKKKNEAPPVPLSEEGKEIKANFESELIELQKKIKLALPKIDAAEAESFLSLYQAEATAITHELKSLHATKRKKADHPSHQALVEAKEAVEVATQNALGSSEKMMKTLKALLEGGSLDGVLAKHYIITHATPHGLAVYAQQGETEKQRLKSLLGNDELMFQMAVAKGARGGQYGKAMEIYEDLLRASDQIQKNSVLQRLALGTAIEHAMPVKQRPPESQPDAPKVVNPVKRYLHFEKAFLDGELDPGFKDMMAWEYRNVVNGDETEEVLTWGREMLRNYRPDHISTSDYRWRYVKIVKTDVRYGSQYNKFDKADKQFFQNILCNGGICGRRAFFGRFICRAFGIPATPFRTPGHGALGRWTPKGWVSVLAAHWRWGNTNYGQGLDFEEYSRGRVTGKAFDQVRRAQMIGDAFGEELKIGFHNGASGFWNGVALYTQRRITEEANKVSQGAIGTDIAEANISNEKEVFVDSEVKIEEKGWVIDEDGTITLSAASCTFPPQEPRKAKIFLMDSNLGGQQMHYGRVGDQVEFTYTFEAPHSGKYAMTSRVVTPSPGQHLMLKVNGVEELVDIALPYTNGMWDETEVVEISLKKGKNVLVCSRGSENVRGLTIKDFTLKPLGSKGKIFGVVP